MDESELVYRHHDDMLPLLLRKGEPRNTRLIRDEEYDALPVRGKFLNGFFNLADAEENRTYVALMQNVVSGAYRLTTRDFNHFSKAEDGTITYLVYVEYEILYREPRNG